MNNFIYLTYDEYTDFGGQLDLQSFNAYRYLAQSTIDRYTFSRLHKVEFSELPERTQFAIKQCVMRLINVLMTKDNSLGLTNEDTSNPTIYSQSNDGVSVTYNVLTARETVEQSNYAIQNAITTMLDDCRLPDGRRLLYRGLYPDE